MTELIILLIGLLSGFLGATVGGAGFFSIPALLFLGFSPQAAIALNKVGDVGTFVSAAQRYWKSNKIDWQAAKIIAGIYIIGSIIGTQVMVHINTDLLEILIIVSILLALPLTFVKRELGLKKLKTSVIKKRVGYIILFLLSIMGAIIGAGGAVLSTLAMMYFFGYKIIKGHATTTPSKIFSALIPSVIYASYGFVEIVPGIIIFIGMLIGGFIGATTALKVGNRWIKILFTFVIVLFITKLVIDLQPFRNFF